MLHTFSPSYAKRVQPRGGLGKSVRAVKYNQKSQYMLMKGSTVGEVLNTMMQNFDADNGDIWIAVILALILYAISKGIDKLFLSSWRKTASKDIELYKSLQSMVREDQRGGTEDEQALDALRCCINDRVTKGATRKSRVFSSLSALPFAVIGTPMAVILVLADSEGEWFPFQGGIIETITAIEVLVLISFAVFLSVDLLVLVVKWLFSRLRRFITSCLLDRRIKKAREMLDCADQCDGELVDDVFAEYALIMEKIDDGFEHLASKSSLTKRARARMRTLRAEAELLRLRKSQIEQSTNECFT